MGKSLKVPRKNPTWGRFWFISRSALASAAKYRGPGQGRSQYAKIPLPGRLHPADCAEKIAIEVAGDVAALYRNQVADTAAIFLPQQSREQFEAVIVLQVGGFAVNDLIAVADDPVALLLRPLSPELQIPDEGELRFCDFRECGENLF